jgi:hypothetical protein
LQYTILFSTFITARSSHKRWRIYVVGDSSVGSALAYDVSARVWIPSEVILFNRHAYNGLGGCNI